LTCRYVTFLLLGQLLRLVPDLGGVQEVGGDLDVAGGHLVDALRDGDRRAGAAAAAAAAAADRRVAAGRARRQFGGHGRRHTGLTGGGHGREPVRTRVCVCVCVSEYFIYQSIP